MTRPLTLALLFALGAAVMADEKKKDPLPKPWEEVVKVRRYLKGNKGKDGKLLEYLNPVECYAFRKEIEGETVFHINYGAPKGEPNFIPLSSEITDEAGDVYMVTKYEKPISGTPSPHHRCTAKKKAPEKK